MSTNVVQVGGGFQSSDRRPRTFGNEGLRAHVSRLQKLKNKWQECKEEDRINGWGNKPFEVL